MNRREYIPDYYFYSGVAAQPNAQVPPPQSYNNQQPQPPPNSPQNPQDQKEQEGLNQFLSQLPPDCREAVLNINDENYNKALQILNQIADEVLMSNKPS